MGDWTRRLFVERSDLFLRLLDARWPQTEEFGEGMVKALGGFGVTSGCVLDLCCGNGRVSVYMAKRGFKVVGVDMSRVFVEDAKLKARKHRVVRRAKFLEGDVRRLKEVVGDVSESFDVVVNAWTSVGYSSPKDDLNIFKQARELSKKDAILFIAQTTHSEYISLKFTPTAYTEVGDMVLMESRKYDPTTSQMKTSWAFYNKRGEDLEFVDRMEFEIHVYSLSELSSLLREAGWEVVVSYGNLSTLQPMSPLTSLNIVAKAR